MSATARVSARPWAAAHRTVLLLAALFLLIAAAAVTIPLVALRGGTPTPSPARAPAQVVQQLPDNTPSDPCELSTIGRPRPC
jgi:hypothetical protein